MTDGTWREERLLIGGKLVDASDGGTFENVNPATEEVLGVVADGTPADMDSAVAAARSAFDETDWSTDVGFRVRCLRQLHESLLRHADEFRATIVAEVGCPVSLTSMAQYDAPVEGVAWVAGLAESYEWETDLGNAEPFGIPTHRYVRREPTGVVAAITPWNFPIQINLAKMAPALAAGNTVVLKPAPDTPWSGTLLGRLIADETDIPPGVVNVVVSSDHMVGQQLAEDDRVDVVSFTGSTATGRKVMQAASGNLKKTFLELGGKSAMIVLDDADIGAGVGACGFAVMTHAGQGCAITTRLLLPRSRYDEGVEQVVGLMSALGYGDPTNPENMSGPLISAKQRDRVLDYIAKGRAEGAKVALGGGRPAHLERGFYVEPTVFVDVDPDSTIAQEEIFGPVLAVIPFEDDDDAVRIANNSIYGLSGGVQSGSLERARSVANRIRTGTMSVNGGVYYGADVPFGGYKQSGIGREMGVAGFEEYLESKTIAEPANV